MTSRVDTVRAGLDRQVALNRMGVGVVRFVAWVRYGVSRWTRSGSVWSVALDWRGKGWKGEDRYVALDWRGSAWPG